MALKEYKVLTMKTELKDDGILSRRQVEEHLNAFASDGWILKDLSISNLATIPFSQLTIVFERDKLDS